VGTNKGFLIGYESSVRRPVMRRGFIKGNVKSHKVTLIPKQYNPQAALHPSDSRGIVDCMFRMTGSLSSRSLQAQFHILVLPCVSLLVGAN
jgi:hypothetical protein